MAEKSWVERLPGAGILSETYVDRIEEVAAKQVFEELGIALARSKVGQYVSANYGAAFDSKWTERLVAGFLGVLVRSPNMINQIAQKYLGIPAAKFGNLTDDAAFAVGQAFCEEIREARAAGRTAKEPEDLWDVAIKEPTLREKLDTMKQLLDQPYANIAGTLHKMDCPEVKLRTKVTHPKAKKDGPPPPPVVTYEGMTVASLRTFANGGVVNLDQNPNCCGGSGHVHAETHGGAKKSDKHSLRAVLSQLRDLGNNHARSLVKAFERGYALLPADSGIRVDFGLLSSLDDVEWVPDHLHNKLSDSSTEEIVNGSTVYTIMLPTFIASLSIGLEARLAELKKPKKTAWEAIKHDIHAVVGEVSQVVVDREGPIHDELDKTRATLEQLRLRSIERRKATIRKHAKLMNRVLVDDE